MGWRDVRVRQIAIALLGVVAGIAATLLYFSITGTQPHLTGADVDCQKAYPLTNHLLDCTGYDDSVSHLAAVDAMFDTAVPQYLSDGKATRVSVWVRDFKSQQWAAYNENDRYTPASLLKLPLMIAYYKIAEVEPSILTTSFVFTPLSTTSQREQNYPPKDTLVAGKSYTTEELIEHMIRESDNDATGMLLAHLDARTLGNILVDLGIKIPKDDKTYDFVTAKTYATIFRILYNASYLDRNYSQKALALLSQSTFDGLRNPLPEGTVVADKFGERGVDETGTLNDTRELHDCGIVYDGDTPFAICIMTEGKNYDDLMSVIRDLSKKVYDLL